ncbi:MAG: SDR family oxidoreductase [Schleiferiaceae bacterium]|jgi:short-subunit dehydrogenase|nr:SDR family oxidoreductase [Schleiferiaceae bacterium]
MQLEGKTIWITGASSGIGEAIAKELSTKKVTLMLSARREKELQRVVQECSSTATIMTYPLDLEQNQNAEQWASDVIKYMEGVDILINNGGVGHMGNVTEMQADVERKVMEVNFWGQAMLTKAILPHMIEKNNGYIITTGSILGKFGSPGLAAYAASKHALYGYFESLREELRDTKINIMMLTPGFINTNVTLSSYTADGKILNKNSVAQEKGMSPSDLARKLITAIEKDKKNLTVGNWEVFSIPFKNNAPNLFYNTMNFLTQRARKKKS